MSTNLYPAVEDELSADYLFLILSLLDSRIVPDSGVLSPEHAMTANTDILGALPKWARVFVAASAVSAATGNGAHSGVAGYIVREGWGAQWRYEDWQRQERSEKNRLNESIDRLTLANQAMFTFMAEQWGITEDDVSNRMGGILVAEFQRIAEESETLSSD